MGLRKCLPAHFCACVLVLLAIGTCAAQSMTKDVIKSPTGEMLKFLGDGVALKYFPPASANCSQCHVAFKLGALSELDAFGQPVAAHTIPDLSNLVPEVTGGQRVSGSVSYHYLTMTFTPARLPPSLTKNNCPSLESIINQAYAAGVGPRDSDLMAQMAGQAAAGHQAQAGPANLLGQPTAPELAQMSPFGRKLAQLGRWLPSIKIVSPSPLPTPPAASAPSPPPAAAAPAEQPAPSPAKAGDAPAAPSSDAAGKDSKTAEAEPPQKPAVERPAADKPAAAPAVKPVEKPAEALAEKSEGEPEQKPASAQESQKQEPAAGDGAKSDKAAGAAPATPAAVAVGSPVPVEPPTKDQITGPLKKAEEPAGKPAPAPAPAAKPAPAVKPAQPAAPAAKPADAPAAKKADEAPAAATPAPAPAPEKEQEQSGSGTIPVPPEKDDNSSEQPAEPEAEPGAASALAPAPAPQPQPADQAPQTSGAVLTPQLPPTQAADLWHQQLAANNGYLPDPSASAAQAWSGYPSSGQYGAGAYSMFGDAPPQIRVTFMFGFSGNKTFAYGRGRVVSAPAGSIKYTIEAQNWPFCSLYNSLKLEVVMASTMKEAQPQFVLSDAADVFEDMDSMRGPATRKLQQSEAFTDFMDPERVLGKKGVAGAGGVGGLDMLGMDAGPVKRVSTAKMLVGPNLAVATEFPTYAFSSDRFTSESNVSVVLATNSRDAARFSLTFRYFEQGLFYDPTMFFSHKEDMMLIGSDVVPITGSASLLCKNDTDCARGGRRRAGAVGNSSSMPGGLLRLQVLFSAAAALLAMLVLC